LAETPSTSRSRSKATVAAVAALVVIVAFIAGVLAGVAGDRLYLFRTHQFFPRRGMEFATRRIVDHLDRDLHLTAQQRTAVQRILDQHRAHMQSIMTGIRPQMRQEIDSTNAEIEKVLTPEQRAQFAPMRMHMGSRRGHGPR